MTEQTELAKRLIAECQADIAGLESINLPAHDPTIAIEELLSGYLPDDREDHWEAIQAYADIHARRAALLNAPAQQSEPAPAQDEQHFDDRAVDRFAAAMKLKLAAARAKGRRGWDNHLRVSDRALAKMLIEHLTKGNAGTFEDVANFAMMLHQRGADPKVLADAFSHFAQTEQQPIYQIRPRENVRDWCDVNVDGYRAAQAMASMETRKLYVAPVAQPAQTELVEADTGDIVLTPEAQKVLAECIGAHAYVVGAITNGREDLALAEASKWVEAFREASAALAAQGGSDE